MLDERALKRFWSKVEKGAPEACWEWTAGKAGGGYGRFDLDGRHQYAHRVIFEHEVERVPDGLVLDHFVCDNKSCVNPAHLRIATQRENILRGTALSAENAVKTHCPKGHPYAGDNLYVEPNGWRRCRQCNHERKTGASQTWAEVEGHR